MRDDAITITTTKADMKLILLALKAYRHNTAFRKVHEKLLVQAEPLKLSCIHEYRR